MCSFYFDPISYVASRDCFDCPGHREKHTLKKKKKKEQKIAQIFPFSCFPRIFYLTSKRHARKKRRNNERKTKGTGSKPEAMRSSLVGSLAAKMARSYQNASETEYIATLARLCRASMCVSSAEAAVDVIGLFAQWKDPCRGM